MKFQKIWQTECRKIFYIEYQIRQIECQIEWQKIIPNRMSDRITNKMSDDIPNRMSENIPEYKKTKNTINRLIKNVPNIESTPNKMPDRMCRSSAKLKKR